MNRALLTLGLAAMGVCWLYPWSLLAALWLGDTAGSGLLSPLTMLALVLLGAAYTTFALRRLGKHHAQAALIGGALLASLVAVRIDQYSNAGALDWMARLATSLALLLGAPATPVVALLLALLLWRRGAQLASDMPAFPDVEASFRWSIGALIGFAVVLAVGVRPSQQPAIELRATPFVVGSFYVALLTLALARLESLRTRSQALALNTQWLGVLIGVAGLLVLGSLAVAQVLSFDLLLLATRPLFDLLGRVLLLLLYLVVIPLAWVIQWIVYWLLQLLSPNSNTQPPEAPQPSDFEGFLQRLLAQALPPDVLAALKALGALLVLGVVLLLVARAVARWRPRLAEADATQEERDSVYQAGSLRQMLLAWLRRLFGRGSDTAEDLPPALADDGVAAASPSVSSVRELYRRLLALGASAGAARPFASTPYEHQPSLEAALHAPTPVEQLTHAYVQVRYAETEPGESELRELVELEQTLEREAKPDAP